MNSPLNLNRFDEIIQSYTTRLPQIKPSEADEEWVKSQCVLAQLYIAKSISNLAIACCKSALGACSKKQHPILWAKANHLAGVAYIDLFGDRVFNLEMAMMHFKSALEIYSEQEHMEQWIETNGHLLKTHTLLEKLREEECMESVWGHIKAHINEKLCFIMMPFSDPTVSGVYDQIIKPIVEGNGLTPTRADSFKTSTPIMPDVWRGITTGRVLIAEMSNFNANVYYELGLCHAINRTPILMIQKGQELPFDLKHFRTIFYSKELAELQNAREELDKFIKEALQG